MKTVGVDLHKETVVVCVLNEDGSAHARKTMAMKCRNQIREYFASYGLQCHPVHMHGTHAFCFKKKDAENAPAVLTKS